MTASQVPVALFAYRRPAHLKASLEALRANRVRDLYVFCDGPKPADPNIEGVDEVRKIVRAIDWCKVTVDESPENRGLGRSLIRGITQVLQEHERIIVVEDDVVFRQGCYDYFCEALERYAGYDNVTSITAWSHPDLVPSDAGGRGFFAGRYCSWGWATYRRAWKMMDRTAESLAEECEGVGIDTDRYGDDMRECFEGDREGRLWAARFAYSQYLQRGLCLWPVVSLAQNIGMDGTGENCGIADFTAISSGVTSGEYWPDPLELSETSGRFRDFYSAKRCPLCRFGGVAFKRSYETKDLSRIYDDLGVDVARFLGHRDALKLFACPRCSLQFFVPALCGDGAFYEGLQKQPWYYMSDKWEYTETLKWIRAGSRVLEVGAGKGDFLASLQFTVPTVEAVGVEINSHAREEACARGLDVRSQSFEQFSFEQAGQFDVVASFQVLEHLASPRSFFECAKRVLRPGGMLVVSVPNGNSLLFKDGNGPLDSPPHHVTRWTCRTFANLHDHFGLSLQRVEYEPLQAYHADWYWNKRLEGTSFPGRIVGGLGRLLRIPAIAKSIGANRIIRGHSILAILITEQ